MSFVDPWKRFRKMWMVPFGVCAVQLIFFVGYRSLYADQVKNGRRQAEREEAVVVALEAERAALQAHLDRALDNRARVERLYALTFLTQAERFTRVIQEIKRLSRTAGLDPRSFSYPMRSLSGHGLVERAVRYNVRGSYEALRALINMFELSDQFLVLEDIALSGDGGREPTLSISLGLSTVFADDVPQHRRDQEPAT